MASTEIPDLPAGFSFEALFRAKVHDEETGFEQCRRRVLGKIDEMLGALEPESPWQDPESRFMREQFGELRSWVAGARVELTVT